MENLNTDVLKMIEELNQYMLPSTLMECFDAWREEAYKQAIRPIPKSSLGWFLDMLNRFRGPEDRKESLLEVFDPSMFTVDHPAWQSPPGTVIELPALTSEIAAKADREAEFAEVAREEVREFREHADPYDDEELMRLGAIALAGLGDLRNLLRTVSTTVRRVMECNAVAVHLPDRESRSLHLFALDSADGSQADSRDSSWLEESDSHEDICEVFRTRSPILSTERYSCAVPLVSRNRVLGVLELGLFEEQPFDDEHLEFVTRFAGQVAIAIENALAYGEIKELKDRLAREKLYLEDEIRSERSFEEIIGRSPAIRVVLRKIETVAPTESTVIIYGETGTGKELVARAIHERSPRCSNSFVKLNCAAIPTGLLESELFGHEKGAFTGAIMQRLGRFELANHGTAFLDEIGEISLELQPKLLRVLQEREFERLGSTRTIKTDARLIAATNRDLAACVEERTFRADLFYRLNVFPIHVPPLRERPEDIPLLVRHFVQYFVRKIHRGIDTIPSETMEALVRYSWPGNIRELQNLIEHAVIVSQGPVLQVPLAALQLQTAPAPDGTKRRTMEEAEREHILATLKETKWVISGPKGAAALLGMNRSTLQFRMKKLGILSARDIMGTGSSSERIVASQD
jgi:formate hydrogenlyase transcriptional activator